MSFRPLPVPAPGLLWLHSMPGRREEWSEFLAMAEAARLTRIVCLNPRGELAALSPEYLAAIEAGTLPCAFQEIPMADFGVSENARLFTLGVRDLARALEAGESALLHCAAGIGRTGTVAACVLKALGLSTDEALLRVTAAGSSPQSALQSGWVDAF